MEKVLKKIVLDDLMDTDDNMVLKMLVPFMSMVDTRYEQENIISVPGQAHTRNENYYEATIPKYNLDEFKAHFRMSRSCFEKLLGIIAPIMKLNTYEYVPIEKKLLLSIWVLSKQESYLSVGDRFGVSAGTAHFIFMQIVGVIAKLKKVFIKFPIFEEQKIIADSFKQKSRIRGIVGAIDGCHIPIKQPPHNPIDFYNRKGFHSIILQGVCDDKMRFIDIFVGMPGRVHDAKVFKCSPLYKWLESETCPIKKSNHLMGDSAYAANNYMITPFKDNGHLSNQQVSYNIKLSSIRSVIERAYAQLKGKFRRLKYMDVANGNFAIKCIVVACILHNFILIEDVTNDGDSFVFESDDDDLPAPENNRNSKKIYFASLF